MQQHTDTAWRAFSPVRPDLIVAGMLGWDVYFQLLLVI
jgi:hypothetical protein